ncbi:MAG: hypothetical protein WCK89_17850, partial [bacterium]
MTDELKNNPGNDPGDGNNGGVEKEASAGADDTEKASVKAPDARKERWGPIIKAWTWRQRDGSEWRTHCLRHVFFEDDGAQVFYKNGKPKKVLPWSPPGELKDAPLYRSHLRPPDSTRLIVLCEGEKATDAAAELFGDGYDVMGFAGAGGGDTHNLDVLAGARVVIWPDHDVPTKTNPAGAGVKVARIIAKRLVGRAASKHIVNVPDDYPDCWDLADPMPVGVTVETLRALIESAPAYPAPAEGSESLPEILTNAWDMEKLLEKAWDALIEYNNAQTMPAVFVRGGDLVEMADHGIIHVTRASLFDTMARAGRWIKTVGPSEKIVTDPFAPPRNVLEAMIAKGRKPKGMPRLDLVARAPFFGADGKLYTTNGYFEAERTLLETDLVLPAVPERPTPKDVARAVAVVHDAVADFPFATASDLANAIGMTISPFVRRMIHGHTPCHFVMASMARAGKGLLVNLVSIIATGRGADIRVWPASEEERLKTISSALRGASPLLCFDNAKGGLHSATYEALITSDYFTGRNLGVLEDLPPLRNMSIHVFSGNNPSLGTEWTGRVVRIKLEPACARPDLRTGFRHPALEVWAIANRPVLAHAVLVLVQNWIAMGRPTDASSIAIMGGFESYVAVLGGILDSAGIIGFLANREDLYSESDSETAEIEEFVLAWQNAFGDAVKTPAELLAMVDDRKISLSVFGDFKSEKSQATRFGIWLKSLRGRVACGYRINHDAKSHPKTYWLREHTEPRPNDARATEPTEEAATPGIPRNDCPRAREGSPAESSENPATPGTPCTPHSIPRATQVKNDKDPIQPPPIIPRAGGVAGIQGVPGAQTCENASEPPGAGENQTVAPVADFLGRDLVAPAELPTRSTTLTKAGAKPFVQTLTELEKKCFPDVPRLTNAQWICYADPLKSAGLSEDDAAAAATKDDAPLAGMIENGTPDGLAYRLFAASRSLVLADEGETEGPEAPTVTAEAELLITPATPTVATTTKEAMPGSGDNGGSAKTVQDQFFTGKTSAPAGTAPPPRLNDQQHFAVIDALEALGTSRWAADRNANAWGPEIAMRIAAGENLAEVARSVALERAGPIAPVKPMMSPPAPVMTASSETNDDDYSDVDAMVLGDGYDG